MLKSDIKVGGVYMAKVSGRVVPVHVDEIRDVDEVRGMYNITGRARKASTKYDVTNLTTNRKTTFRSAAKFRRTAHPQTAINHGVPPCDATSKSSTSVPALVPASV